MSSIKQATVYNVAGAAIPTLLALITIPIYLRTIGAERYGALSAIWIICGTAGFLDLGLTRALSYSVAKFSLSDRARCSQIVATGLLIATLSASFGALLTYGFAGWYFNHLFKAEQAVLDELALALPLIALISVTNVLQGVVLGTLQGNRNFLQANLFLVAMTSSLQLGPLVSLDPARDSIVQMMVAVLALRCLSLMFGLWCVARALTVRALFAVQKRELRPLLSFSKWTMGISIAGPIILFADKAILGALSGATALALYNIPFQLAQRITIIPAAVGSAMFPNLVNGTAEERSELTTLGMTYIYLLLTLPALLGILISPDLLSWWLGVQLEAGPRIACGLLILAFWANCMGQVYHMSLVTMNKPATVFYIMIGEILIYIPLIYFAIDYLGIVGAALGFLFLCIMDALAMLYFSRLASKALAPIAVEFCILLAGMAISILTGWSIISAAIAFGFGALVVLAVRWPFMAKSFPIKRRRRNA